MSISAMVRLLIILCLLLLTGCAKPYVTTARERDIGGIKTQKLCLISFSAAPDIAVMGGSVGDALRTKITEKKEWEKQLAGKIAGAHLSSLVSEFKKQFTVVGPTDSASVNQPVALTDKSRISDAIGKAGAEAGVIVYDKYGWIWEGGGISQYNVETRIALVNQEAELIWGFHSAATFLAKQSVKGIISSAISKTPDDATIVRGFSDFLSQYPKVVVKLIDEDIAGQPHQAKFEDYVSGYNFWITRPPVLRTKSD